MSLKSTPEATKTVSMTGGGTALGEGPTPKNEFKKPLLKQKQYFMSPTDAMVSPCTQKLQTSRLLQRKPLTHKPNKLGLRSSSLANKENDKRPSDEHTQKLPETIKEEEESAPTPSDS